MAKITMDPVVVRQWARSARDCVPAFDHAKRKVDDVGSSGPKTLAGYGSSAALARLGETWSGVLHSFGQAAGDIGDKLDGSANVVERADLRTPAEIEHSGTRVTVDIPVDRTGDPTWATGAI